VHPKLASGMDTPDQMLAINQCSKVMEYVLLLLSCWLVHYCIFLRYSFVCPVCAVGCHCPLLLLAAAHCMMATSSAAGRPHHDVLAIAINHVACCDHECFCHHHGCFECCFFFIHLFIIIMPIAGWVLAGWLVPLHLLLVLCVAARLSHGT